MRASDYIQHGKSKGDKVRKRYYFDETRRTLLGKNTQKCTDYVRTLLDPFADLAVRIPDLAGYPTSVARQEANFTWAPITAADNTNSQMLCIDLAEALGYYTCQRPNQTGTGVSGDYTGSALSASAIGTSDLRAYYDQFRVVSAAATVKFADNDTATKGVIWCCSIQGGNEHVQGTASDCQANPYEPLISGARLDLSAVANWQSQKQVYMGPLVNGATCRYQPCDAKSFMMLQPASARNAGIGASFGKFVFWVDGATNGVLLQVSIVVNIEAIPLGANNQLLSEPSYINSDSLDMGMTAMSHIPNTFGNTPAEQQSYVRGPIRYINSISKC